MYRGRYNSLKKDGGVDPVNARTIIAEGEQMIENLKSYEQLLDQNLDETEHGSILEMQKQAVRVQEDIQTQLVDVLMLKIVLKQHREPPFSRQLPVRDKGELFLPELPTPKVRIPIIASEDNLETSKNNLLALQNNAPVLQYNFNSSDRPGLPAGLSPGQNRLQVAWNPKTRALYLKLVLILKRSPAEDPLLAVMGFDSSDTFRSDYCVKAQGIDDCKQIYGMGLRGNSSGGIENILFLLLSPEDTKDKPPDLNKHDYLILRIFNVGKDKHKADVVRCKKPSNPLKPRTMVSSKSGGDFFILATVTNDYQVVLFNCDSTSQWYSTLNQHARSKTIDLSQMNQSNQLTQLGIHNWKLSSVCFDESQLLVPKESFRLYMLMYKEGKTQLASLQIKRDPTKHFLTYETASFRTECSVSHLNVYYQHAMANELLGLFILIGCRNVPDEDNGFSTELVVTVAQRGNKPQMIVAKDFGQFSSLDIMKSMYMLQKPEDGLKDGRIEAHFAFGVRNTNKVLYLLAKSTTPLKPESTNPFVSPKLPVFEYKHAVLNIEVEEETKVKTSPKLQDVVLVPPVAYFGGKDKSLVIAGLDDCWNLIRRECPNWSTSCLTPLQSPAPCN